MKWPWHKRKLSYEEKQEIIIQIKDGCKHDWLNWSEPVVTQVRAGFFGYGGDSEGHEALTQTRKCIKCNMAQRRVY